MNKLFQTLYSKLSLALLLSFTIIGVVLVVLVYRLTDEHQLEVKQQLHQDLAAHVVKDNQLFKNGALNQQAIKQAFHDMMILGPSFEFYVLDSSGRILTFSAEPSKIKRAAVALQPIHEFLSTSKRQRVLGDDPRSTSRQKIFSAAAIRHDDQLVGYLYVIIGGEIYDSIVDMLSRSHISNLAIWVVASVLAFAFLITMIVFSLLTRPLRKLSSDMQNFRDEGFSANAMRISNWDEYSADEVHKLGRSFKSMAIELSHQYQKVRGVDEMRKEFIAHISHDLRTPLASLLGYLETWQINNAQSADQRSKQLIDVALKNAQQIGQLIEQLFELAYLEGANVALQLEPVAVAELAQDVLQSRQLAASDKQLILDVNPKDPDLIVMADIAKLERVFSNLIDNAIRHCNNGDRIEVSFVKHELQVEVHVRDSGIGIPEEELPYVFDPYYRASNSKNSEVTSSGLGLSVTRRILELHGATIEVFSRLNQGTDFQFRLGVA